MLPANPAIHQDCSPANPDAPAPSASSNSAPQPHPDCPEPLPDQPAPATRRPAGIKRPFRIPWQLNPTWDHSQHNQS